MPKQKSKTQKRRAPPGSRGRGRFYRIEMRPKKNFVMFRNQDVGRSGNLERLAGKRENGKWDTVSWLVEKDVAHVDRNGELVIDDPKTRTALKQIRGKIVHKKGDVFEAKPRKNVPEKSKPTTAQRRALKKARQARRK